MAVLKIVVLVLLTRLLSPADFGVVSAALIVIVFALTFSQLGLGPALVQRPDLQPAHISTAFLGLECLWVDGGRRGMARRALHRRFLPDG